ncbi:hypothetical protein EVA_15384 [gut metagenome]|uniref:Uncharacterized protein n=1 Tax=gut metagenome TaxID=749906 RepID=J9GAQ6_9ZZZZ
MISPSGSAEARTLQPSVTVSMLPSSEETAVLASSPSPSRNSASAGSSFSAFSLAAFTSEYNFFTSSWDSNFDTYAVILASWMAPPSILQLPSLSFFT